MSDLPAVLQVEQVAPDRWVGPNPENDPEGRDIVFSGQLLAQMIMVASAALGGEKEVKSVHAIFARAGRYSQGPVELLADPMHSGRAWASTTLTAVQGERLLSRGLVLLNSVEPDLIRHAPDMPDVPAPDDCPVSEQSSAFPDSEVRTAIEPAADRATVGFWVRYPRSFDSVAANQAIVAWGQPGSIIGAAMQPHRGEVDIRDSHRSISTGVISHTAHFHDRADAGEWLLFVHDGSYAGNGRIFGTGAVYNRDRRLISTFAQDSMARRVEGPIDAKTGM
jgi:acyl-CoA thioesterase